MDRLLHYEISKKLGEGKNSETFLALDTGLQRPVVIKKFLRRKFTQDEIGKFNVSRKVIEEIGLAGLGVCYSIEEIDSVFYLMREYVEGYSIRQLAQMRRMSYSRTIKVAIQISKLLQQLHSRDQLHLNITSGNIFENLESGIKLLDHSLAPTFEQISSGRVAADDLIFLAPEQVEGKVPDVQTDFYSLGIVIYEALTGQLPFAPTNRESLRQAILAGEADLTIEELKAHPPEINLLLKRLLALRPSERFSSASELLATLEEMSQFHAHDTGRPPEATPPDQSRKWLGIGILFMLLLIFWLVLTTVYR